jgi:transmembrane sensor
MRHLPDDKLQAQIREQASEWLVAFSEEEVDTAGQQDFLRWLRTSPQHIAAYLRISALWEGAGDLGTQSGVDLSATIDRARVESTVVPLTTFESASDRALLETAPSSLTRVFATRPRVAIAACLLLLCAGVFGPMLWQWTRTPIYTTGAAEQRTVRLSDGSLVQLNARSRVELRFNASERRVDLVDGQALFSVAHDQRRPFIVRSAGTRIRAVGTRFDVNRVASATTVTVTEGRVAISAGDLKRDSAPNLVTNARRAELPPVFVSAGEQVVVKSPIAPEVHRVNVSAATAWTEGKLVLDSTPLRAVVEQLNRTAVRRLVMEDESLLDFHISGIFPYADPAPLVRLLQQRFGVTVEETDDVIHIRRPPAK